MSNEIIEIQSKIEIHQHLGEGHQHENAGALSKVEGINTGDQDLSHLATKEEVKTDLDRKADSVHSHEIISHQLDQKVNKVENKQLSTEDYTTEEKSKLALSPTVQQANQSAPTISTEGKKGDVIFDANNHRYEMIGIVNGEYIWALPKDVFPAVNVPYPVCIENGVVVWKIRVPGTSGANINVSCSSPPCGAKVITTVGGGMFIDGVSFYPFPLINWAGTFQLTAAFAVNPTNGILTYSVWTGYGAAFHRRPMYADFYFTK